MADRKIGPASLARLMGGWRTDGGRLPAYQQIGRTLRLLILDGRLPIGTRLPGERHLAAELSVSRTTITAAYAELRDLGFVDSRHGSGSVIRLPDRFSTRAVETAGPSAIDFSVAAMPAPKEVHAAYTAALAELPRYLPETGYVPTGIATLREAIAKHYRRRGVETSPDEILVTQGAQHAFVMILGRLARPGDRVVTDHPTYSKAIEAIYNAACRPVPVPLPPMGWDVDQLRAAFRQTGARLGYLLPDFHNPTGRCMDEFTRSRVVRLATDLDCHLVIDETMADLSLDSQSSKPMAAFDGAGRIISVGSMGKSFWGGLRVGWVRAGRELIASLAAARAANDMGSPVLEQLAAAALLENPDAALIERRETIRRRRDFLLNLVKERLPDWRFEVPPGGLSAWAELPQPLSSALASAAFDLGVRIAPGNRFGVDGAFERYVRLPYALPEDALREVVDRLELAWAEVSRTKDRATAEFPMNLTNAI